MQQSEPDTSTQPNERLPGLDGASNQEWNIFDDAQHEEEQYVEDQVSWAPENFRHIDESDPARHSYHRIMMKYAAEGDPESVENILEDMEESGLEPGPFAHHACVFACVKAGRPDGGLAAMREMFAQGLKPIAQSYTAMIHGYMRSGQAEEAQAIFRSLQSSGHDACTGWLAITTQLFAAGHQAAARQLVEHRQPEWLPDADLYEHIIKSVCSSTAEHPFSYMLRTREPAGQLNNADDHIQEALQVLLEMQTRMVVELRHISPILEACAVHGSASAAETLIKQMMWTSQYPPPDGHCMESLAKAHIQSGSGQLREGLKTVLALVHKAQLPVTKKMRALLVEGSLLEDDLQGALKYFHTLRPAGRMATSVPDHVLDDLLYKLSAANMPTELLRTVMLMKSDFMRLPPVSTDPSGRSFLTLWLGARHLSPPPAAPEPGFEGVKVQPEVKAKDDVTEVDGVKIYEGKYAMNDEGKVLSPSAQKVSQLKAELTARGLSTKGKSAELKRRVMAARSNEPPDMAKAIRKREAKQDAKRKKQREKEAAAGRGPEAQLAGPDSDNKLKIQITSYGSGVPKFVEEFEAAVEDDEDVMDDVEEDIDPMQPASAATALDDDSDYLVSDGNSAEDLLDDSNDAVSDLPAPPVSVTAPTQRLPSNQECGAEVAMQLLAVGIDLFGSATAQDYEQMLQAAEAEQNPLVARLAGSWHPVIELAFDPETVCQMYTRAAKVCIAAKGTGAVHAQNVLQQALQRGVELDSELQEEIQQQIEQQQQQQPTSS